MSELKNPGLEQPKLLDFDEIPSLREFLANGGWPGCSYLYVAAKNMPRAQQCGWEMIVGLPFFNIGGIGSALMARGEPIKGSPAQPGTSKCPVFADAELLDVVSKPTTVVMEVPQAANPVRVAKVAPQHTSTNPDLLATK